MRIADVNRTIETCVSLDDNNTPVFQSTCDAQNLNLETSLTLPTVRHTYSLFVSTMTMCLHRQQSVDFQNQPALDSVTSTGFSKMPTLHVSLRLITAGM